MKDLSKLKLVFDVSKIKVSRKHKNATPDGFNGYGKVRSNQNVYYGYFTHLKDKSINLKYKRLKYYSFTISAFFIISLIINFIQ